MKLGLFSILAISITSLQLYGYPGVGSQTSQQSIICEQIVNGVVMGTAITTKTYCPSGWTIATTHG